MAAFSCGQNVHERELNGKWYSLKYDGHSRMYFYPDSLILTELYSQKVYWKANDSTYEFDFKFEYPYIKDTMERLIFNYRLSETKDTLVCKVPDSNGIRNFEFIRAENYIDYLSKKYGLKLNLPIDLQVEHAKLDSDYGFKIFVKQINDSLIGLTEFGNSIDFLISDLKDFKQKFKQTDQFRLDKLKNEIHFRVFADRTISDEQISDFLQKTNGTKVRKAYRIYTSEEYPNLGYMRGKAIKTIANTVSD